VLLAIFAPWIAPHDPIATSWSAIRKSPSAAHWFGTDEIGRDVLSRVIFGARASLLAGVVSVGIAMALGVPIGLLAGYAGRWPDALISRMTDAMLATPFLILAIALAAFLGPSLTNAMIAIGISATPIFIRLTRASVLSVKVEDYVEAARAVGNSHVRIAVRHVLPNVLPPLIVQATLTIAASSRGEPVVPGSGQQPPEPSWGQHAQHREELRRARPVDGRVAGVSTSRSASFNLLGDGLQMRRSAQCAPRKCGSGFRRTVFAGSGLHGARQYVSTASVVIGSLARYRPASGEQWLVTIRFDSVADRSVGPKRLTRSRAGSQRLSLTNARCSGVSATRIEQLNAENNRSN
jgi:peptide/nickel transport system permease protein